MTRQELIDALCACSKVNSLSRYKRDLMSKAAEMLERDTSHPFANGRYDHENANRHYINGYEDYREWMQEQTV